MASHKESAKDVLKGAEEMLYMAFLGLDLSGAMMPVPRWPGYGNVAVFGRAFINVLESLRLQNRQQILYSDECISRFAFFPITSSMSYIKRASTNTPHKNKVISTPNVIVWPTICATGNLVPIGA